MCTLGAGVRHYTTVCPLVNFQVTRYRKKPGHTGNRNMVPLQYGFLCESSICVTGRRTLDTWSKSKEFRHCVSSGDSLGDQTQRKPGHTEGRDKGSLRCEFSCESSSGVNGKRTLYNWSRSKEFPHCVSSGDSLGYYTQIKPGHTECRDKVSLRCGFSCESLNFVTARRIL